MIFRKSVVVSIFSFFALLILVYSGSVSAYTPHKKPDGIQKQRTNILFIISDDQSYPHASAYGSEFVNTPNFDRIAKNGLLFTHSFVAAPQCSPSRASILTGRYIWQNGPAGTHASIFPAGLITYTDILKEHGYQVGYTGKGWAPGSWRDGGRSTNPAGRRYDDKDSRYTDDYPEKRIASGISSVNYAKSFQLFLEDRDQNKPFCFWMGGHEPHRPYEQGSGLKRGKKLSSVHLPKYLPNADVIKSDMLDYAVEIEWFDRHVGRVLDMLKKKNLLDNTLVIYTGDNGMPFPRAKALSFEAGTHTPLAMMWKNGPIKNPGRTVDDMISMVDIFPTILEATGLQNRYPEIQGRSLMKIFKSGKSGLNNLRRKYIFWGRERHSNARWHNFGYPQRAIRSKRYLYIWNLKPERYPAGTPKKFGKNDSLVWAYQDIDGSPTKTWMIKQHAGTLTGEMASQQHQINYPGDPKDGSYFQMAFGKFPEEMLYDIQKDPYCLHNLADKPGYQEVKNRLAKVLKDKLKATHDPRLGKTPNIWNSYRRYGPMRRFPEPDWVK